MGFKEDSISKFEEVHGEGTYDYSQVECTKATDKITIKCAKHNHEWQTSVYDHAKGKACKFCGYDRMTSKSRMSIEDFVEQAQRKHGDKFDYSDVEYVNARTNVKIICKPHAKEFYSQPHAHLKSKFGCPLCEVELKKKNKTKRTTESFIEEAKAKHCDRYTYERFSFSGSLVESTVTCTKHGDFQIKPSHHLRGKGGCKQCGSESKIEAQRSTQEDFVEAAKRVHGESTYDYSPVKYKNGSSKVDIRCHTHGIFAQRASKHLEGSGCPDCAKTGFSVSKNATMYVLQAGDITKVGITNLPVRVRRTAISNDSGFEFMLLREFDFESGQVCTDIETILLRELRKTYKSPHKKFDGYTECFYGVDHKLLFSRIEELTREYDA